jgi:glutathione S-transferase
LRRRVCRTSTKRLTLTRRKSKCDRRTFFDLSDISTLFRHFLDINPKGLVPALEYKGRALNESLVIAEFVEEAFPDHKPNLLPPDAFERARIRLWVDHISKKIVPAYFRTIQAQEEDKVKAGREDLNAALKELAKEVKGPYFLGQDFSLLDAAIAPFAVRDYILSEHRGYDRAQAGEAWKKYAEALAERDSVKRTSSVSATLGISVYLIYSCHL